MPTHAVLASRLLQEAAKFFSSIAEENLQIKEEMIQNARVFMQMAQLLEQEPGGKTEDKTHGELAGKLLMDAAAFFRILGEKNEPIGEQMFENARVFESLGHLVSENPLGEIE